MPEHEEKYPNKQMRKGVEKDLWIYDNSNARLHHHVESPRSILTAISHGNRVELIEQMIGMKCYFQEKLEKDWHDRMGGRNNNSASRQTQ